MNTGLTIAEPFLLASIAHSGSLIYSNLNYKSQILEFILCIIPMYFGIMYIVHVRNIAIGFLVAMGLTLISTKIFGTPWNTSESFSSKTESLSTKTESLSTKTESLSTKTESLSNISSKSLSNISSESLSSKTSKSNLIGEISETIKASPKENDFDANSIKENQNGNESEISENQKFLEKISISEETLRKNDVIISTENSKESENQSKIDNYSENENFKKESPIQAGNNSEIINNSEEANMPQENKNMKEEDKNMKEEDKNMKEEDKNSSFDLKIDKSKNEVLHSEIIQNSELKKANLKELIKFEESSQNISENTLALLMTCISIFVFAADFEGFNSDKAGLAKPGNVGIMDLATGLVTSGLGFICIKFSKKQLLFGSILCTIVGIARFLLPGFLGYQLIPEEFGENLNYAFILSIMCILALIKIPFEFVIGIGLCILHEFLLFYGLKDRIFAEKTDDFLSKNIEGISCIIPECGLFMMARAISVGRNKLRERGNQIFVAVSILFGFALPGSIYVTNNQPCRRTHNLPFSMFVMSLAMTNFVFFGIWEKLGILGKFTLKSFISANPILLFGLCNLAITGVTQIKDFQDLRSFTNPFIIHSINILYLVIVISATELISKLFNKLFK